MQQIVSRKIAEWKSRANDRFKYVIVFRIGKTKNDDREVGAWLGVNESDAQR
jgi:hypothetical protein